MSEKPLLIQIGWLRAVKLLKIIFFRKKKEIKKEIVAKIKCLGKERKNWDLKFFKQNKIFSVLIR